MQDELLTRREAAAILRLEPETLDRWNTVTYKKKRKKSGLSSERLPVTYVGKEVRYRYSDIMKYIAESTNARKET